MWRHVMSWRASTCYITCSGDMSHVSERHEISCLMSLRDMRSILCNVMTYICAACHKMRVIRYCSTSGVAWSRDSWLSGPETCACQMSQRHVHVRCLRETWGMRTETWACEMSERHEAWGMLWPAAQMHVITYPFYIYLYTCICEHVNTHA